MARVHDRVLIQVDGVTYWVPFEALTRAPLGELTVVLDGKQIAQGVKKRKA